MTNATPKDELLGTPRIVRELVAYQAGSIVSRTLLKKKAGTITLFAFDQGQSLSEHTAPFDAFVLVLEGEAEISLGGKPLRVRESELLVMPAGIPHALQAVSRFKMLLVMVREAG
ncbi:MAG: cupin domain-containing protein [Planctomycetota bacterium]